MSKTRRDELRDECARFHRDHPQVWTLFCKFTADRIESGFKNYSVNAIFERIRWESDQASVDGKTTFKLNNNYRAFYARRYMKMHPEFSGFFRTRVQKSEDQAAIEMPPLGPQNFPTWPQPPRQIAP